ncbi:L-galactose dehydrogenase-like [Sitophilus oryzae]|uniref:L-galactose dehydrogenase-like n=1 Tax=Sitophilus oryzae TaxID=7048 RepID=A0A6J2XX13_SITOR|nr:L-galactose dehydrogenase-like [Sitophilus oryzae]
MCEQKARDKTLPETFVPCFHDEKEVRKMTYNPLGNTGLKVSKISLGTSGFSNFYGEHDVEECKKVVYEAVRRGINLIDTAPWYGHGDSEKILGTCLEGIPRKAYYLSTKCCRYEKDLALMFDFSAERTRKSIDESLTRLKLSYVDILQVHDIEFAPTLDMVLKETLPTVAEICKSGKARHVGITGYPLSTLKECIEKSTVHIETVLTYCRSMMTDNTLDEYIDFFRSKNVGVVNGAIHGMALLTNVGAPSWHPASDELKAVCREASEFCQKENVELGKLALYYSMQHGAGDTILVGTKSKMKLISYNLDVLHNGLSTKEQEVYEQVLKILKKLPPNSNWEDVEVERYRSKSLNLFDNQ